MEKFTVDLDKVLDDFELQEDQEDVYSFQPNISKLATPQNTEANILCQPYIGNDEKVLDPPEPLANPNNFIIHCESQAIHATKDSSKLDLPNDSPIASDPSKEQALNLVAVNLTKEGHSKRLEQDEGGSNIDKTALMATETDHSLQSCGFGAQDTDNSNSASLKALPPNQLLEENPTNQPALSDLIQTNILNSTNMSMLTEAELERYLIELEQEDFLPTSYNGENILQSPGLQAPANFPTFTETVSSVVADENLTTDLEDSAQNDEVSDAGLSFELPEGLEIDSDDGHEPKLFDSPQMENTSNSSNSDLDDSETDSDEDTDDDDVPNLIDDPSIARLAASQTESDSLSIQASFVEDFTSTECACSDESVAAEASQEAGTGTSTGEQLPSVSHIEERYASDAGSENSGELAVESNVSNPDIGSPVDDSIDSVALAEDIQGATALEIQPYTNLTEEERLLGILKPLWIPDEEASVCMNCSQRFTVIRRRHHCRACGKVLCSTCCSCRARLEYMEGKEARVCLPCLQVLKKVEAYKKWGKLDDSSDANSASDTASAPSVSSPSSQFSQQASRVNPNNPAEYCSTIPPAVQAASVASLPIPTVMVPVGVLKKEGSSSTHTRTKSEPKQVIFSDGIRPGGDLTELDAWRAPPSENSVVTHRVSSRRSKPSPPVPSTSDQTSAVRKSRLVKLSPEIPPVLNGPETLEQLKSTLADVTSEPVVFVLQPSQSGDGSSHHILTVNVKLVQLDCCIRRTCWFFATSGMRWVAQDEIVILLEKDADSPDGEPLPPVDILYHLLSIYEDAKFKHHVIVNLGHTVTPGSFLGSTEHGGFLYFRTTFQCVQQLKLPSPPYLVGVLLQRWEIPWAKVFPLRLLLRLGAEFRYYPCPLFSVRKRKSVFGEVGHTIINLLADMRNYSYSLPAVTGLVVHMEEHETNVLLPKNRYHQLCKALAQSNDHVISLAASFSPQADAHLVCLQADDGSYQTQAINIHTRPRKVTGASFLVLNGALKSSSGLTGRSSIVEDGVMVQLLPDKLEALKQALIRMEDFTINCGKAANEQPEEIVTIKWIDQEPSVVNAGVVSPIDGRNLSGISSIRVMQPRDYKGEGQRLLRWTELFILQMDERQLSSVKADENSDITRFAEGIAKATCAALAGKLAALDPFTLLGLRISSFGDSAEYQAGADFKSLPTQCCEGLDSSLIPILHRESSGSAMPCVLELWFQIFHP